MGEARKKGQFSVMLSGRGKFKFCQAQGPGPIPGHLHTKQNYRPISINKDGLIVCEWLRDYKFFCQAQGHISSPVMSCILISKSWMFSFFVSWSV